MTTREQAAAIAAKYGLDPTFIDVLTAEDIEARASALAAALQQERGRDEAPQPLSRWFLPPIRLRGGESRRTRVGVDVVVAGRHYAGGRWHGPLTGQQVDALERAGFADRIFTGQVGSEESLRFEESLPVEPPIDPLEEMRAAAGFGRRP